MSDRYPGGIITKTPVVPAGPYQNGAAPGIWTLEQQAYWKAQGLWPIAGNTDPSAFIENLFSTYLYTGNGSTQTITNGIDLDGEGGLVWIKQRNTTRNNLFFDTARGDTNYLVTNTTAAQSQLSGQQFNSNGFSVGSNSLFNQSAGTYASWTFRKQPKFFDVVTYTGTGSNRTIAHNLGSAPGCIIVKRTNSTGNWQVYHRGLTSAAYSIQLNLDVEEASATTVWNSTAPTSTVFSVGTDATVNASGGTYVAYLFAHDAGGFGATGTDNVISCSTFTSNSNGQATVSLGYEPQWVLWKTTTGTDNWFVLDNMRGWNLADYSDAILRPNTSGNEATDGSLGNPTATGFFVDGVQANSPYIYIAIRRGPMATPTSGTEVFKPVAGTASGPAYNSGFVADAFLGLYTPGDGSYPRIGSRLTGTNWMQSSGTGAETSDSIIKWDYMNGVYSGSLDSSYVGEVFRRAPGFFDVVCYTGTGSARTLNHNLTVAPEMMIVKNRTDAQGWRIYHTGLGGNDAYQTFGNSDTSTSAVIWNNTAPTSSVFSVGNTIAVNDGGYNYVAYLFATLPGVSKVGSYTGTGTTNSINCGFTSGARFVLIKSTANLTDWYVWDSARGIVAGNDPYQLINTTNGQVTNTDYVDTYASGFEITSTAPAAINANGGTFIFLAIA
jgi:hypothetical protein